MLLHLLSGAVDDGIEETEILTESVDAEAFMKETTLKTMHSMAVGEKDDEDGSISEAESALREEAEGYDDHDDETSKQLKEEKIGLSQRRRSNTVNKMFQVGEIPTYYKMTEMNKFQRVRIDEFDEEDGEDADGDAAEASMKILRALALHEKWTRGNTLNFARPLHEERKMDIQLEERKEKEETSQSKKYVDEGAHYRRKDQEPKYDPFRACHEAMHISDWSEKIKICDEDGIYEVIEENVADVDSISLYEFAQAYSEIRSIVNSGPVKTFSYTRLAVLEELFNLHVLLNGRRELLLQKKVPHRDFYNVRKVDTHVHHSACMNQKHLLRFIKSKLRKYPHEIVLERSGQTFSLEGVFESLHLTAYDLSIDSMDMHAHNTFHRFDRFNLKYNPAGQSRLREIFLKTDNFIQGRYLAEITKEVISDLEQSKYQFAEWRVSIYGRNTDEWSKLANWFYDHKLSSPNVRWMIQIPRLYSVYKKANQISSFAQLISNIFQPLFYNTLNPAANPKLHALLQAIVGFDSVDDESKPDLNVSSLHPDHLPHSPSKWTSQHEPSYPYWMFYLYANIRSLNSLRAKRGFSTFEFRPHCGEAGDLSHLVAAFLTTNKINHGIQLKRSPALQYLYYLANIGIAMSPLSNNRLFLEFSKNPFPKYFKRGLNVSLSTDDPLMLHFTKDPLVEEYSIAAQIWKLSSIDLCEIARNSVLQSGIEDHYKRFYLGDHYKEPGAAGNDIRMTNVPDIRVTFRYETQQNELKNLRAHRLHSLASASSKIKFAPSFSRVIEQHAATATTTATTIKTRLASASSV